MENYRTGWGKHGFIEETIKYNLLLLATPVIYILPEHVPIFREQEINSDEKYIFCSKL